MIESKDIKMESNIEMAQGTLKRDVTKPKHLHNALCNNGSRIYADGSEAHFVSWIDGDDGSYMWPEEEYIAFLDDEHNDPECRYKMVFPLETVTKVQAIEAIRADKVDQYYFHAQMEMCGARIDEALSHFSRKVHCSFVEDHAVNDARDLAENFIRILTKPSYLRDSSSPLTVDKITQGIDCLTSIASCAEQHLEGIKSRSFGVWVPDVLVKQRIVNESVAFAQHFNPHFDPCLEAESLIKLVELLASFFDHDERFHTDYSLGDAVADYVETYNQERLRVSRHIEAYNSGK